MTFKELRPLISDRYVTIVNGYFRQAYANFNTSSEALDDKKVMDISTGTDVSTKKPKLFIQLNIF